MLTILYLSYTGGTQPTKPHYPFFGCMEEEVEEDGTSLDVR